MLSNDTTSSTPFKLPDFTFPSDLFVLDLRSLPFLCGTGRLPVRLNINVSLLTFLVFGFLTSILLFGRGANDLATTTQLIHSPATTDGAVVNYRASRSGRESSLYRISYRYSVPGRSVQFTQSQYLSSDVYDRLSEGAPLTIRYLVDNPGVSMIVGVGGENSFQLNALILLVVGVVGIGLALVYLAPVFGQIRTSFLLTRENDVIIGQVLYCRRYTYMAAVARTPDADAKLLDDQYFIELSYRFRTPNGKEIRGWNCQRRNDLKGCKLPTFGASVAVLYRHAEYYRVL